MADTKTKEQARKLLNNLNLGTQKAELGDFIVALVERVEALEARVEELETPAE